MIILTDKQNYSHKKVSLAFVHNLGVVLALTMTQLRMMAFSLQGIQAILMSLVLWIASDVLLVEVYFRCPFPS